MDNQEKKPIGAIIGLLIILLIIIIGGIYFWGMRQSGNDGLYDNNKPALENTDADSDITSQSDSNEPEDIEADLDSFNSAEIDNLDSSL